MASSSQTMALSLILTSRCNLKCRYCYQSAHRPRSMSWTTLRAAIDFVLSKNRPAADLTFYGGEPLLEFPLLRRAVEHAEAGRPRDMRVRYRIVTNGTLMSEEVTEFLVEHGVSLQLSFDGIKEAQDVRGEGSFAVLDHLLDSLASKHPRFLDSRVEIGVTVPPTSVAFLAGSFDYFVGKGVRMIDLTPVLTPYPGWTDDGIEELDEQFERILRRSLERLEATGEVPLALFRKSDATPATASVTRAMCEIVDNNSWAVDTDGQVYGCTLFARSYQDFQSPLLRACFPTLCLGDIRDPKLLERCEEFPEAVSRLAVFAEKEKKYSSYRACADCAYFASCVTCPASIGHIPGNRDPHRVPDYYCAFIYASMKSRERFPTQPSLLERIRGDEYEEERLKWRALAEATRRSGQHPASPEHR